MPAPRKVDLLPLDLRAWLKAALVERGFAGYEDIADELNAKLVDAGSYLRIQKSALHEYGQEYREFVKVQEEATAWASDWLGQDGVEGEAQRHSILFQMLTAIAFKWASATVNDGKVEPKDLAFVAKTMKDLMGSAALREKMVGDYARAQAAKLDQAVATNALPQGLSADTVEAIKRTILGVA